MVDEKLLRKLKEKFDAGPEAVTIADLPLLIKFSKQLIKENDELAEEYGDLEINVSLVIKDFDKKFWIKIKDSDFDFGEGEIEKPSFTLTASMLMMAKLLFGVTDATSAYMGGDISVDGNLADAMAFNEIIEMGMEIFEELVEEIAP
jgi:putative sterol carrier protein